MRRRSLLIAAGIAVVSAAAPPAAVAQAPPPEEAEALLPLATDLRQLGELGRRRGVPVVLLFSTPGCPYCLEVRRNYLAPRLAVAGDAPLIREVVITGNERIVGFDGNATTHARLAERYGVRMVPVVMALDARGDPLAEPLVGLDASGFYEAYLQSMLDRAQARLQR